MSDASPVSRTLLVLCVNQGISASFFHFLIVDSVPQGSGPLRDPNSLFLILASTCLPSFITSGLGLALLGSSEGLTPGLLSSLSSFQDWRHPEADSSHREGRSTRGQDQLCRHLQASAHTPSTNANHITESNLRETRDSTSRGENYKVTWQGARTQGRRLKK